MQGDRIFSPAQCRAARGLLDWSQEQLAAAARIELDALEVYELGQAELSPKDLAAVGRALEGAGVVPIGAAWAGEGVRFRESETGGLRYNGRHHGVAGLPPHLRHLPLAWGRQ